MTNLLNRIEEALKHRIRRLEGRDDVILGDWTICVEYITGDGEERHFILFQPGRKEAAARLLARMAKGAVQ